MKKTNFAKVSTFMFAVAFLFSLFFNSNISAAANIFKIQDATLEKLTETVQGEIESFDELSLVTNVEFYKLEDAVKYTVTIKNTDSKPHTINSITDNIENDYLVYEYDPFEDVVIDADGTFELEITVKYVNAVEDPDERIQSSSIKFTINYDGEEEEIWVVPDTGAGVIKTIDGATVTNIAIFIVSGIGLVLSIIISVRKNKRISKRVVGVIIAILALTITVSAKAINTSTNVITFVNNYSLLDTPNYITVNLHGNGLKFSNDRETNSFRYAYTCQDKELSPVQISRTDTFDEDGNLDPEDEYYLIDYTKRDVIRMPGANSMRVTVKYSIEDGYDFLYIFQGEYTGELTYTWDMTNDSYLAALTGGDQDYDYATDTIVVDGDVATLAFFSDDVYPAHGYYAVIEALDENGDPITTTLTGNVCENNVISGNYEKPTLTNKQEFYGWSLDSEYISIDFESLNDIFENSQAEPGDTIDLYAAWLSKHTITYNGNGATDGENYSNNEYCGTGIRLDYNSTFSRDGYELTGWSTNPNATIPEYYEGGAFTVPSDDGETVFYAVWAKYHTVYFDGNGSTSGSMPIQSILQGMTESLDSNRFSRTNYNFAGWSTDQNATQPMYINGADFTAPTDSDVTVLYAVWRVNPVVTFDGNGATSGTMSTQQFTYNTPAQLNNNGFSRTNYDFLGWSLDKDATAAAYANRATFTPPTDRDQVTLYAIWIKKFEIIYDSNGGEGTMSTSRFSRGDSVRFTKNAFTRYKYAFIGWSTDPNATEAMYVDRANYTVPSEGEGITLYAVWEPAYVVTYGDGDATSGTMSGAYTMMHRVGDEGDLVSPNLEKDGYGFVGWSPDPDAASKIDNTSNQPTIYGPNERITLTNTLATTADDELEIPLYAVWIPADENYTFQTFDKTAFEAANPNKKVVALRDERDGNVYAIAKQKDGKWWMIENLRLDFSDSNTNFTAANSNNPAASFVSAVAAYKGRTNTFNNCNSQSAACYNTISFYTGNLNSANAANYDQPAYADKQTPLAWYSYGVLYNQYTANASYLGYEGTSNTNNTGDICAKGWRLPTGLANGDFSNLDIALGGQGARFNSGTPTQNDHGATAWTKYPVNGVKAGLFSDQGIAWRNQAGVYLSATKGSYNSSNASAFFTGYVSQYGNNDYIDSTKPGNYWETSINAGFAVRCIAK